MGLISGAVRVGASALLAFASYAAFAAELNGSFSVTGNDARYLVGDSIQFSFTCALSGTNCDGSITVTLLSVKCSNSTSTQGDLHISGLDLSHPGPIGGKWNWPITPWQVHHNSDGTCTYTLQPAGTASPKVTGQWDGSTGTITLDGIRPDGSTFHATGSFTANGPVGGPFPIAVSGGIANGVATFSAQVGFRPQDVGTSASIYVFALAPVSVVKDAALVKRAYLGIDARGAPTDAPVQCVIAQVDATGQLAAASTDSLHASVTGVLTAQGQAVSILNGVPAANVAGATFFVGYGPTSSAMINNGVNRSAVTIPGSVTCQPEAAQTGWWWNPAEDGRGFSIEVQGTDLFFAAFLYDVTGRSTWYVASGPASLDGSYFVGDLYSAKNGQTLGGPYPGFPATRKEGTVTMAFTDASHGTLTWPGGTVPMQRFDIVPGGLTLAPAANQPQSGWWWNEQENGRGFFLEWQGPWLDMAGYMYDDAGNPVWYITVAQMSADGLTYSNTWWSYAGGQTLTGPWQPNHQVSNNVAPVTVQFTGPDTAIMTLPNSRSTTLKRQRF